MSVHAILAPSGIWHQCAASLRLSAPFPDEETEQTREGTAVHWGAEQLLQHIADPLKPQVVIAAGMVAPNGVVLTDEMVKHITRFVEFIIKFVNEPGTKRELYLERRVSIEVVHSDCWGTLDIGIYDFNTQHLTIIDLKYGWEIVEPGDQGNLYLIGLTQELIKRARGVKSASVGIYQPRPYHEEGITRYKHYMNLVVELNQIIDRLKKQALLALSDNAPATPGKHCKHCPARVVCLGLKEATDRACDISGESQPLEMDAERLSHELQVLQRYFELLKIRVEALEEMALERIKKGEYIPEFHLGRGRSSRKWAISDDELITMGDLLGIDIAPRKLKTVAQAEDSGLAKSLTDDPKLVTKIPGKLTLKNGDISTQAKKVFKQ
jgi:hypothetical protein